MEPPKEHEGPQGGPFAPFGPQVKFFGWTTSRVRLVLTLVNAEDGRGRVRMCIVYSV